MTPPLPSMTLKRFCLGIKNGTQGYSLAEYWTGKEVLKSHFLSPFQRAQAAATS